jgi:hypothetical protein
LSTWATPKKAEVFWGRRSPLLAAADFIHSLLARSRGGFGSWFHLFIDGRGLPLTVEVTAEQVHESTCVESVMEQIAIPQPVSGARKRPSMLASEKGCCCNRVGDWLRRYGITPLIPHNGDGLLSYDGRSTSDKRSYRKRCIVGQTICWVKKYPRIGTRFAKRAINFLAMEQPCLKIAFHDRAKTREYPTLALTEEVRVSIPTIARIVASLREKGHDFRVERHASGFSYAIAQSTATHGRSREISEKRQNKRAATG